jgi:hypothetical protein
MNTRPFLVPLQVTADFVVLDQVVIEDAHEKGAKATNCWPDCPKPCIFGGKTSL